MAEPILKVRNLTTSFRSDQGIVTAVENISFDLFPGESLGLVGESGCGKTVTSKSIMRLLPEHRSFFGPESRIELEGQNLTTFSEREMRIVRGNRIAMIFQEPMTALNPVFTVGWQLDEALKQHTTLGRKDRRDKAIEMLTLVEMSNPATRLHEYPHQLSGGMRQRVMIAMALCCEPDILIADEPTTALDVTIQAQILRLMEDLKQRLGTAILLITHDLGVVAQVCDRVVVMYAGQVVETAPVRDLFHSPQHPYTQGLLDSIPKSGPAAHGKRLPAIPGIVPSLWNLPSGCRFHERCAHCEEMCRTDAPQLEASTEHRSVRCFFPLNAAVKLSAPSA
ncbi:MAG: ABC transporter ATP-binding protein [Planctomycetota bacterium]|nr:ABC transporter ATP-binding protein [Planctomycetota bacterium]MDA1163631.1 ABC transporter ATP-binding protein [Planctomycetota bacterium]